MRPTRVRRHQGRIAELERFLLHGSGDAPSADSLERNHLEPYAYLRFIDRPSKRSPFRRAFLAAMGRHLALKSSLQELVAAWAAAGVNVLVFKGFYLAEFVYDVPAARHYSDVDILMDPEHATTASEIATSLGWVETWRAGEEKGVTGYRVPHDGGHEVMHLQHPDVGLRLDVHRRIIHNKFPWTRKQDQITQAAWSASEEVGWGQTNIRALRPTDSILIGLILHRCWSSDDWHLKAHDFLDFSAIVDNFGVTETSLRSRAEELKCRRTLDLFLQRCNPFRSILDLRPPQAWRRHVWNLSILSERGHPRFERDIATVSRLPATMVDMCRQFPVVIEAVGIVRRDPLMIQPGLVCEADGMAHEVISLEDWKRVKRGVRWNMRLLGMEPIERPVVWCLALFLAVRRMGSQARLMLELSGTEMAPGEVSLEVDGELVEEHPIDTRGSMTTTR